MVCNKRVNNVYRICFDLLMKYNKIWLSPSNVVVDIFLIEKGFGLTQSERHGFSCVFKQKLVSQLHTHVCYNSTGCRVKQLLNLLALPEHVTTRNDIVLTNEWQPWRKLWKKLKRKRKKGQNDNILNLFTCLLLHLHRLNQDTTLVPLIMI